MTKHYFWIMLFAAIPTAMAEEGIVLSQPPDRTGAWTSDTDFTMGGTPSSQQLADDFMIDEPAAILRIRWWGHYGGAAPPAVEATRIRLYDTDFVHGLPRDVLFEQTVLDPSAEVTGLLVLGDPGTSSQFSEYIFEVDFMVPMMLSPNTAYWLEIAQLGDPSNRFRWEFSATDQSRFAFMSPTDSQWQLTSFTRNLAFELSSIPEPATLAVIALGVSLSGRYR